MRGLGRASRSSGSPGVCQPGHRARRLGRRPGGAPGGRLVRWAGADRGAAAVLVALWCLVLMMLGATGVGLSTILAARETVASAADLAALAGASATLADPGDVCTRAARVARANGATLSECRVEGVRVWVVVHGQAPAALGWLLPGRGARVRARAHAELTAEDP